MMSIATTLTPAERLARIAELIGPCPPPDIAAGYDLCPCGTGVTWPCNRTRAAWLAAGKDLAAQILKACEKAIEEIAEQEADLQ